MNNRQVLWITLGGFLFFWVLSMLFGYLYARHAYEQERERISVFAAEKAHGMQRLLDTLLQRTYLLARLTIDDKGNVVNFHSVAEALKHDIPMLSLQLAPGGTVTYSLPDHPHLRSHISLFERPERRAEAIRSRDSRQMTFSGPLMLTQGYPGFIVRRPVYGRLKTQEFWGFSIIVFPLKSFVDYLDLATLRQARLVFSLYRKNTVGGQILPVAGYAPDEIVKPVSVEVELPDCSLVLSLMPATGWNFTARAVGVFVVSLLVSLILTALLRAWCVLKRQQHSLQTLVDLDPLTGLRNRRSLFDIVASRCREDRPFALLYIDLNEFKGINDTYGHEIGDAYLTGFVARVKACLQERDIMFRLGGDEFLVLCSYPQSEDLIVSINKALQEPLVLGELRQLCKYSMGVAVYPSDGRFPDALLRCADVRMYKDKGRYRRGEVD